MGLKSLPLLCVVGGGSPDEDWQTTINIDNYNTAVKHKSVLHLVYYGNHSLQSSGKYTTRPGNQSRTVEEGNSARKQVGRRTWVAISSFVIGRELGNYLHNRGRRRRVQWPGT